MAGAQFWAEGAGTALAFAPGVSRSSGTAAAHRESKGQLRKLNC